MATATLDAPVETQTGNKPLLRLSDRGVHLSIWPNSAERNDGTTATFYTTTVESRYRDKQNHWQTGHSFDEDQLAILSELALEARRQIRQARTQDKAAHA